MRNTQKHLPVIVCEGDLFPISHGEAILRSLVPVNVINTVGVVIVTGNDNIANELLGAFVLEVLSALLVDGMP